MLSFKIVYANFIFSKFYINFFAELVPEKSEI